MTQNSCFRPAHESSMGKVNSRSMEFPGPRNLPINRNPAERQKQTPLSSLEKGSAVSDRGQVVSLHASCPLSGNGNYIDGHWDLWGFACDRLIPTLPGYESIYIPGQPTTAEAVR